MKTILGLDLGTNSIGWALIQHSFNSKEGKILGMGSRIIPISQDVLGKFDSGQSISQTAQRTEFRGARRLFERDLLRRERLHRVLNILEFLPKHYANEIDFEHRLGQFIEGKEPKIAYQENPDGKFEFIFQNSFNEMLEDFKRHQPDLVSDDKKVPYDWTIYYLRKKALSQKIEKEELAWILLNFLQKRGYYQLRGEEEEIDENKEKTFVALKVSRVVDSGEKIRGKDLILYDVYFENGWKYDRQVVKPEDWLNKTKEFIVSTTVLASGETKRTFKSVDSEQDWIAIKQKTEQDISVSNKTVGEYIYETLLQQPNQKIRGKLIRTIERKFYKSELKQILNKQQKFHAELTNKELYNACLEELYEYNEAHRKNIATRDFIYLFLDDIIFYQRPLKIKKSLISNCSYEYRTFTVNGIKKREGIKCIAKSNPIYQEFRLLQWMKNLKILRKDDRKDVDITNDLLPTVADREKLFHWLNDKTEIDQNTFLKYPGFELEEKIRQHIGTELFRIFKKDKSQGLHTYYRWNYVEDKKYPLNETRGEILKRLTKLGIDVEFLNSETETQLWHILYSVEDREEIIKALNKFTKKHSLNEAFIDVFRRFPRIEKDYGAFSEKAIKKLLTVMRFGTKWSSENINDAVLEKAKLIKERLDDINYDEKRIDEIADDAIHKRVLKSFLNRKDKSFVEELNTFQASYLIYNRHSETSNAKYWKTAEDVELLKQHSLRNPIVEQVINETLQTVRDIWTEYGEGEERFFDEIHVELGREMKNDKQTRERLSKTVSENEKTNIRIKALLNELFNDGETENVRPYSPMQQEILKIYEEGIYGNEQDEQRLDEIDKIRKKNQPTPADLKRYKLWLEQGYKSPYTGEIIPLSKLFTTAYEIEHIIPQSRFFDDSISNKIICEAEVNELKDKQLAFEFIKNNRGLKVELSEGKIVTLLSPEAYEENVKRYFAGSRLKAKREKLLLEDIPDRFIERQMNDTRYISKVIKSLLSNILREEGEEEGTAKNLIVSSGGVTARLKQDWGLNDVWNGLITPRFERLNEMAGYDKYGSWENKDGKRIFQIDTNNEELLKLNKKRIDHRHHALDALIVACSSRNHVNYINNDNANGKDKEKPLRFDLRNKLRRIEKYTKNGKEHTAAKEFLKPWETFTQDTKNELQKIIVSFKKNNRVINKTVNYYQKWEKQSDGSMKKVIVKQKKGDSWAVRKPLHKDTVSGLVNLRLKKEVAFSAALDNSENIVNKSLRKKIQELKSQNYDKKKIIKYFKEQNNEWKGENISRIEIYYFTNDNANTRVAASRVKLDESFTEKRIESITDTGIQKILLAHLEKYKGEVDEKGKPISPEIMAFSADGIEALNKNITELNNGKAHAPIFKVRTYEKFGSKFNVGTTGNKKSKYVEAAKGTNLFFAIYTDEDGNRSYETVPLNIVIERQKQGLPSCPATNEKGHRLLFDLSPNDLVYVPTVEEQDDPNLVDFSRLTREQVKRIYKFVSCTGNQAFFIQSNVSTTIINKIEFSALNKMEKSIDEVMIKAVCWKLELNRLGKITKIIK